MADMAPVLAALVFAVAVTALAAAIGLQLRNRLHEVEQHLASERAARAQAEAGRSRNAEQADRLRAILERMGDGLITVDVSGRIDSVNPAAEQIFGYSAEELVGEPVARLADPDALKALVGESQRSSAARLSGAMATIRGRHKNGGSIALDVSASVFQVDGEPKFIIVARDVSAREQAVTRAQQAEARLRTAIDSLPDAFVVYDAEDRLVTFNERYRELYPTSADLLIPGAKFEDMIREGVRRGQYLEAGDDPEAWIQERLELHRNPPSEPLEQHLDDGRWLRVFERRTPDGQTVGFRIDITELKQREEALRRSESHLRAMVHAALDAIIVLDEDGTVVDFNPAAERTFGHRRSEVVGRSIAELLVPAKEQRRLARRLDTLRRSTHADMPGARFEASMLKKDGSEILVAVAMSVAMGPQGKLIIGFLRDVTEERAKTAALEEAKARAEEANRVKANFLAMMSHEIRTPLNAVMGILDLLKDSPLDATQRRFVKTAKESASALLQLLNDILDLSRLEAGRLDFSPRPFSPGDLIHDLRDLFVVRAEEKGLTLATHIGAGVPPFVVGDAGRIRQVLINLVGNAVKFTASGGVELSVHVRGNSGTTTGLRFEVCDTGPGIPENRREQVFQKFTTLDASLSRQAQGAGLGLAICRDLVQVMGGLIGVGATEGGGARFWVDLDLPVIAAAPAFEVDAALRRHDLDTVRGAEVLLAEDNATNRMMTSELLKRWNCRVDTVVDGRAVLERLDCKRYDVVLMDMSMPVMDGVAAARAIRARGDAAATVPIIAFTAHTMAEERDRAFAAGMSDFVTKPIDSAELLHRLAQAVATGDRLPEEDPDASARIDRETLQSVLDNVSAEMRQRVLEQCARDLVAKAEILEGAAGDLTKIASASHVLNSLAGTFGAGALYSLSDTVNRKAMAGDPAAMALVADLARLSRESAGALRAAMAAMPPAVSPGAATVTGHEHGRSA